MVEDLRKERLREPISRNELERRWKAVRTAMEKEGLDCLVMQNSNLYLGGYVRYFTDIPAENGYPMSVIFPVDDEITIVSHGGKPLPTTPPEWALYGVKERIALPYLPTLNFTDAIKTAFSSSMDQVFIIATFIMGVAFVVVLFLPEIPLRKTNQKAVVEAGMELEAELGMSEAADEPKL